ncbi:MAG: 13E12 repeat family protein [Actinomycetota bacterium]|nr:13E12 repeat family protein [Actinomycetota bacterium]
MFERLSEEIDELSITPDSTAIAAAVALRDRLEAKIAEAVATFDAASLWDLESATSMTAWLRHHAGMTSRDAGRTATAARRLRDLPETAAAWQAGEISSGQLHAILAGLDRRTIGLFAEHEAALVPTLVGLSVTDTARVMAYWRTHASSALDDDAEPVERERALHLSRTLGHTWALDGVLDPEGGEVLATALRLADSPDVEAEPARTSGQRRADALIDVCRFFWTTRRTARAAATGRTSTW